MVGPVGLAEMVDQVVLEGIRKAGMEEGGGNLGLVEDTIPEGRHTAYQDIQGREDLEDQAGRHDPNHQVEEDRMGGIVKAGQMEAHQEDHPGEEVLGVELLVAEGLVDFVLGPVPELAPQGEIHSIKEV